MKIVISPGGDDCNLILSGHPVIAGLSEHDLRDLEFVLAQRRAMSRRCDAGQGEHTCSTAPQHGGAWHLCRACTHQWPVAAAERGR